ncbi:kinase-like domain-containing protein [Gamsiella multidivaricata]|uniref:kinase-like domain-containing protein n=1 Tax=Gamsiella multidivaricata TaxID=101098 RepID=UPI00221EA602|nr:kinase-like domain-containing protein [Gamsiella multidivaricata]KAI7817186.1 kinase-like domain-containing protein [Gamsiella multidivaricata]
MRIQWTDLKTFDIIGSGSFGRVFHGELLGTEVAIKECVRSNSRAFDEKYFRREVDILKESRHPNIVQFMGICKRKKRVYIITEFLPLGNLRRWIQDETKEFGWDTRISFAIDISLALAYLHHKNIIHRDLKGENLLISENMRIKVCDFGFSRVEAKDDNEMRRISYCGTDGYMAPEILLGEDFDCSVDVFSFGIVLAEMMARHVVDPQHFQRLSPDFSVSSDEILFRAQEGCPVELGELAIHCVQPQPRNRPKLRQIVERLTAIENVDIHVGIPGGELKYPWSGQHLEDDG